MHEQRKVNGEEEVSLPEAALEIGVTRQTGYIWALTGRMKARKLAGRYVVTQNEVARVKKARANGTWKLTAA